MLEFYVHLSVLGCGFCKRLKPDFAAAATELKGDAVSTQNLSFAFKLKIHFFLVEIIKVLFHFI